MLLACALAVSGTAAQGQSEEAAICADPAGRCAGALSAACLHALGAGALAAPGREACAGQIAAYRACLSDVATRCAEPAPAQAAGACDAETARQLWTSAERSDDCAGYGAFLEVCPAQPQAAFARAARARLGCDASPSAASAPPTSPATTNSFPTNPLPTSPPAQEAAASAGDVAPFVGRWIGAGETTQPCPGGNPLAALLGGAETIKPIICYDVAALDAAPGVSLRVGVALPGLGAASDCAPNKSLPARLEGGALRYGDIGGESVVVPEGDGLRVTVNGRCLGDPTNTEVIIYRMRARP